MSLNKKYHIDFHVALDKKSITAVSVALDSEIITDMNTSMSINLSDHPLYPQLEAYVKANPSNQKPGNASKH